MYDFGQNRAKKRKNPVFESFLPIFELFGAEKILVFSLLKHAQTPVFIVLLAYIWEMWEPARIAQNQENWGELGWGTEYRKEIELSIQKTENGILPTADSALKTGFHLHLGMSGWGSK